jgi:hypothetical protein
MGSMIASEKTNRAKITVILFTLIPRVSGFYFTSQPIYLLLEQNNVVPRTYLAFRLIEE